MRRIDYRKALPWVAGLVLCGPTFGQGTGGQARPANPAAAAPRGQAARNPQAGRPPAQAAPNQGAAAAQLTPDADPQAAQKMDQLLAEWEQRSAGDESLLANFTREDKIAGELEPKKFEGIAMLQRPDKACLVFNELVKGKEKPEFYERIVATGQEVYDFRGPVKKGFVYPLDANAQRRAMQEGPLPFMFNMRADEAKKRFRMRIYREDPAANGRPARSFIEIIPLMKIDREEYIRAIVVLNRETFLPEALYLLGPNGKDEKVFLFKNVQRNPKLNPAVFDGRRMANEFAKAPYNYKIETVNEAAPEQVPQASAPPAGAPRQRQPAMRPGATPGRR